MEKNNKNHIEKTTPYHNKDTDTSARKKDIEKTTSSAPTLEDEQRERDNLYTYYTSQ